MKNIAADSVKILVLGYCCYKTYATNGEWLQTKLEIVSSAAKYFKDNLLRLPN